MRRICLILFTCILFVYGVCPISTASTSMTFHSLSEKEKNEIVEGINLQNVQNDSKKESIQCFDVSENGMVAIGIGSDYGNSKTIYVYDTSGIFQYGFQFDCDGDYAIIFQGNLLSIYFLRGNVFAVYDATGTCVDVQKVEDSSQNYALAKEILNRTTKSVAGNEYMLERDMSIGNSYSRLVVTDEYGSKVVFYDVTQNHNIGQIAIVTVIVLFFSCVMLGYRKKQRKTTRLT